MSEDSDWEFENVPPGAPMLPAAQIVKWKPPSNDSGIPDDEMLLAEALARFERRPEFDLSDDVGIAVVPELEPSGEAPLFGCRWAAEAGAFDVTGVLEQPELDVGLVANADRFHEIEDYYAAGAALAIIASDAA